MSSPFLGQLMIVGFNYAPVNWSECNGQVLPIGQNTALFALLGTNYGGNGTSTFALPNLQGRVPIGIGSLSTGQSYSVGAQGGYETVTLATANLPAHQHLVVGDGDPSNGSRVPIESGYFTTESGQDYPSYVPANTNKLVVMNPNIIANYGGGQSHNNIQPTLVLRYVIAMQGIFPPRN